MITFTFYIYDIKIEQQVENCEILNITRTKIVYLQ